MSQIVRLNGNDWAARFGAAAGSVASEKVLTGVSPYIEAGAQKAFSDPAMKDAVSDKIALVFKQNMASIVTAVAASVLVIGGLYLVFKKK